MNPKRDTFIAPGSYTQKSGPDKKFLLIVGGILFAVIIGAIMMLSSGGESTTQLAERLTSRLQSIINLTDHGDENLNDSSYRNFNAEMRTTIKSDIAALSANLTLPEKPSESITLQESEEQLAAELDSAKIEGKYNETYKKVIQNRLDASAALISEIYEKSNNATAKAALEAAFEHINTLQDRLAAL